MASSDYDRPMTEQPADATSPPSMNTAHNAIANPVGIVLAILFVVLLMMALAG